ncbi:hypothetical protein EYF80_014334 [Liparis tanakae]|uniref:Uncharacterized protein n=1 Tax=Liparis tanakae TaxID=230148 RepID=A0A4Z2IDX4_9TELE|nr:hypothetical protein EYF80_014334 [Liparis tanakae]
MSVGAEDSLSLKHDWLSGAGSHRLHVGHHRLQDLCQLRSSSGPTWYVAEHRLLEGGQGEGECYMFGPLVPHTELNQQGGRGRLQVKAALQHGGLRGGGFGRQVHDHQALKLLQELLGHGVARALGLLPCHLEPVERLVHLHHLLVESACAR